MRLQHVVMSRTTSDPTDVLVVLSTDLKGGQGRRISGAELVEAAAIGVNYFVRRPVDGLGVEEIAALVRRGDGRRIRGYAEQLWRFANADTGTLIVTNTVGAKKVRYLCGRLMTPYTYRPDQFTEHPHVRGVAWTGYLPQGTRLDGNPTTTVRDIHDRDLRQLVTQACSTSTPH